MKIDLPFFFSFGSDCDDDNFFSSLPGSFRFEEVLTGGMPSAIVVTSTTIATATKFRDNFIDFVLNFKGRMYWIFVLCEVKRNQTEHGFLKNRAQDQKAKLMSNESFGNSPPIQAASDVVTTIMDKTRHLFSMLEAAVDAGSQYVLPGQPTIEDIIDDIVQLDAYLVKQLIAGSFLFAILIFLNIFIVELHQEKCNELRKLTTLSRLIQEAEITTLEQCYVHLENADALIAESEIICSTKQGLCNFNKLI